MKEVLLKHDVADLGKRGDVVKVADGYARNFLFPKGLAAKVTTENVRLIEAEKVKLVQEEMKKVGEVMASKLNSAQGPTTLMIPLKGFSMYAREGHELYDPVSDNGFIDAVKSNLNSNVRLVEIDAHINDPEFSLKTAEEMIRIIEK